MELVEGDAALDKCSVTPLMKAGDMSMFTERTWSDVPLCASRYSANWVIALASLPSVTNTTFPFAHIGSDGEVIVATPAGRLVDRHRGHL